MIGSEAVVAHAETLVRQMQGMVASWDRLKPVQQEILLKQLDEMDEVASMLEGAGVVVTSLREKVGKVRDALSLQQ